MRVFGHTFFFAPILLISALAVATPALAQPDFLWVKRFGGSERDAVNGVAVDPAGDVVVTGFFEGTADFEGTSLTSAGGTDVFVAKLSPDGALRWVRRGGGVTPVPSGSDRSDWGSAVATDAVGNIYVTGSFLGEADFASRTVVSRGDKDVFLAKYTPDGALLWVQALGGVGTDDGYDVAVTDTHAVVTGFFESALVVGRTAVGSRGESDFFIVRFDTDGAFQWVRSGGGGLGDAGTGVVALRSGLGFVSGYFSQTGVFDGRSLATAGSSDLFLGRYRLDGSLEWVASAGGTGLEDGAFLAYDGAGNLYAAGAFQTPADFGGTTLIGTRTLSAFITRVDAATGDFIWATSLADLDGRDGNDVRAHAITVDAGGEPISTGAFTGTVSSGGLAIQSSGDWDVFVARHLSNDGSVSWLKRAGGPGRDQGLEVAADAAGNVYVGGSFVATAFFESLSVTSRGLQDAFVAKLGEPPPPPPPRPVAGDRFEPNDSLDTATVLDGWNHIHELCPPLVRRALGDPDLRCPNVWEDGVVGGPVPSRGTLEIWELRVEDLSIGEGLDDRNFFSVRLPDPGVPVGAATHDILTTEQRERGVPPDPLPECDAVERTELGPPGWPNIVYVHATGTLTITVVPTANGLADRPVSTPGESIHLYTGGGRSDGIASGTPLSKTIGCPRSRRGLTEIAFSFGERTGPRTDIAQLGGYTLLLEYVIDIERGTPEWVGDVGGIRGVPGLPCGSGAFPRFPDCPSLEPGLGLIELMPFPPDCLADGPGCWGWFTFDWVDTQRPFEMSFFMPFDAGEARFILREASGQVIGEAKSVEHLEPLLLKGAQAPVSFNQPRSYQSGKTLRVEQLPAGRYYLGIHGPPVRYRMEFTPVPVTDSPVQQTPVQE